MTMLEDTLVFIWSFFIVPYVILNAVFAVLASSEWRTQCWEGSPVHKDERRRKANRELKNKSDAFQGDVTRDSNETLPPKVEENPAGNLTREVQDNFPPTSNDDECETDSSLLVRIRSYVGIRFVSSLVPMMHLLNMFCLWNIKKCWWWYLPYAFWCIFLAEKYGKPLGNPCQWVRRLPVWRHACEYFPSRMLKEDETAIYPPNKNYLIGFHPHGIWTLSCSTQFGGETGRFWTSISRIFPGIDVRLTTLEVNLRTPFWRHLLQALGFIACSRKNIFGVLSGKPGKACVVVVGGAKEALHACTLGNDLVLKRRTGFFKIALQTGSSLVPVYSLGENEMFFLPSPSNRIFAQISRLTQRLLGFSVPVWHGRGLFQLFVPRRIPIYTMIGCPIECPKIPNPTAEEINEIREKYCAALKRVFEKVKIAYRPKKNFKDLQFIE